MMQLDWRCNLGKVPFPKADCPPGNWARHLWATDRPQAACGQLSRMLHPQHRPPEGCHVTTWHWPGKLKTTPMKAILHSDNLLWNLVKDNYKVTLDIISNKSLDNAIEFLKPWVFRAMHYLLHKRWPWAQNWEESFSWCLRQESC